MIDSITLSKALCPRCKVLLAPGKYIKQTYTGMPDFIGGHVVTLSAGGPGKLADGMKCHECGFTRS